MDVKGAVVVVPLGLLGPVGPIGPQGIQGNPGPSLNFLGSLPNTAALPATANIGDTYLLTDYTPDQIYSYGSNGWIYTGDAGVAGPPGPVGPTGPQGPVSTSSVNLIAGMGLSGGGKLDADRTINIEKGFGITVYEDKFDIDQTTIATKAYADIQLSLKADKSYVDSQDGTRVRIAGETMTGKLTLSGDPTVNLHAATKQYVDATKPYFILLDKTTDQTIPVDGSAYEMVWASAAFDSNCRNPSWSAGGGIIVPMTGVYVIKTMIECKPNVQPARLVFGAAPEGASWHQMPEKILLTSSTVACTYSSVIVVPLNSGDRIMARVQAFDQAIVVYNVKQAFSGPFAATKI